MIDNKDLLLEISNIAIQAGEEILNYYNQEIEITQKNDSSPLTQADIASNKLILNALYNLDRSIPALSEESLINWEIRKNWKKYWLIDPLDGTKEFIKKNGEFTVNIALIENNNPTIGVVFVPVTKALYLAQQGFGSYKINTNKKLRNLNNLNKISVSKLHNKVRIIGSRSHSNSIFDDWVNDKYPGAEIVQAGSSLKFCLIAEGKADIYPRFGPTSEWDIAAGHIIVNEAGGRINTFSGGNINYNTKEDILNPHFYVIGNFELKK